MPIDKPGTPPLADPLAAMCAEALRIDAEAMAAQDAGEDSADALRSRWHALNAEIRRTVPRSPEGLMAQFEQAQQDAHLEGSEELVVILESLRNGVCQMLGLPFVPWKEPDL